MSLRMRLENVEGFQSQKRTISSLPIRIDYQTYRQEHFIRPRGEDWLLTPLLLVPEDRRNSVRHRESTNLDPYAVRDAFEAAESAEDAARFLSECGRFWQFEAVLWSQFREWQAFFQWLRLDPAEAKKTPEGKRAWDTAGGYHNSFFAMKDAEFSRSRFRSDVISEIGSDRWKEIQKADSLVLRNLRSFALDPGRAHEGKQASLYWYPKDRHAPEDWKARGKQAAKGKELEPYLRIEALYVVEAIAATIYADHVDGFRSAKCKQCGKFFKIESDHGQQFCPAPPHLKSSPCKNAFLQKERRKNERMAIEFIVKSWKAGQNKAEILSAAETDGFRLNPTIWAKANRKHPRAKEV